MGIKRKLFWLLALIWVAAVGCGGDSTSALIGKLSDGDPRVRREAAEALANHSNESAAIVPALEHSLADSDTSVRLAAALSIATLSPENEAFRPVILESLRAGHAPIFVEVGQMGPAAKWAVPTLVELLSNQRPQIRALAAKSLGQIGATDGSAQAALQRCLRDENKAVRKAAEVALGPSK
jgi:HEAT repeat protein